MRSPAGCPLSPLRRPKFSTASPQPKIPTADHARFRIDIASHQCGYRRPRPANAGHHDRHETCPLSLHRKLLPKPLRRRAVQLHHCAATKSCRGSAFSRGAAATRIRRTMSDRCRTLPTDQAPRKRHHVPEGATRYPQPCALADFDGADLVIALKEARASPAHRRAPVPRGLPGRATWPRARHRRDRSRGGTADDRRPRP